MSEGESVGSAHLGFMSEVQEEMKVGYKVFTAWLELEVL